MVPLINDKFRVRSPESINLPPNIPSYTPTRWGTRLSLAHETNKDRAHPAGDIPVRAMREFFDSRNIYTNDRKHEIHDTWRRFEWGI